MANLHWQGKTALITGASSGIGSALATQLAQGGCHLIITARRGDRLEALAADLRAQYKVQVDVITGDLSVPGAATDLVKQIVQLGRTVDLLINNAGFGMNGTFTTADSAQTMRMLQVNVMALVELTQELLPSMLARGAGDIMLVSSIAGFMPIPELALYAASKALVLNWGEALAYELRGSGVRLTVLCPGTTATEFMDVAGYTPGRIAQLITLSAERVARDGLKAMARGKRMVVPGFIFRLGIWSSALLPRCLQLWITSLAIRLGHQPAKPPAA